MRWGAGSSHRAAEKGPGELCKMQTPGPARVSRIKVGGSEGGTAGGILLKVPQVRGMCTQGKEPPPKPRRQGATRAWRATRRRSRVGPKSRPRAQKGAGARAAAVGAAPNTQSALRKAAERRGGA